MERPSSTFLTTAEEDFASTGIFKGDTLIIDTSFIVRDNDLVVCNLNGECLVRKIDLSNQQIFNDTTSESVTEQEFKVIGVITRHIRNFIPLKLGLR